MYIWHKYISKSITLTSSLNVTNPVITEIYCMKTYKTIDIEFFLTRYFLIIGNLCNS